MGTARKFKSRATRFVLRQEDEKGFRFAFENDTQRTFSTRFTNVSTSGLAFITERDSAPNLGDQIKVEFPTHSGKTIAWFAEVVRVEEFNPKKWWLKKSDFTAEAHVLVGVRFINLPEEHQLEIQEAIDNKFKSINKEYKQAQLRRSVSTTLSMVAKFVLICSLAISCAYILYWLAQPSDNYDPEKGTFWGKRFKQFLLDE